MAVYESIKGNIMIADEQMDLMTNDKHSVGVKKFILAISFKLSL